jgi:hypothetical protein
LYSKIFTTILPKENTDEDKITNLLLLIKKKDKEYILEVKRAILSNVQKKILKTKIK